MSKAREDVPLDLVGEREEAWKQRMALEVDVGAVSESPTKRSQ